MKPVSLEAKKAYFAKMRRSNYVASLRLEGFRTRLSDADQALETREAILRRYRISKVNL